MFLKYSLFKRKLPQPVSSTLLAKTVLVGSCSRTVELEAVRDSKRLHATRLSVGVGEVRGCFVSVTVGLH